jgi:hypothetical protein
VRRLILTRAPLLRIVVATRVAAAGTLLRCIPTEVNQA